MPLEIERKYLLRGRPPAVEHARSVEIDQGYLPGGEIRERIRRIRDSGGFKFVRTLKAGLGIERIEIEEETTEQFFLAVWPLTRGCRVQKRRYDVPDPLVQNTTADKVVAAIGQAKGIVETIADGLKTLSTTVDKVTTFIEHHF